MRTSDPITSIIGISAVSPPPSSPGAASNYLQHSTGLLSRAWRWIRSRQASRSNTRRLHVAATVSLGEKRFVAVIQVDGLQFLIGGGATNVTLLAQLNAKDSFGTLLNETMAVSAKQPVKRASKKIAKPATKQMGEQV